MCECHTSNYTLPRPISKLRSILHRPSQFPTHKNKLIKLNTKNKSKILFSNHSLSFQKLKESEQQTRLREAAVESTDLTVKLATSASNHPLPLLLYTPTKTAFEQTFVTGKARGLQTGVMRRLFLESLLGELVLYPCIYVRPSHAS
jgi:3-dehydroquinate dehydratase